MRGGEAGASARRGLVIPSQGRSIAAVAHVGNRREAGGGEFRAERALGLFAFGVVRGVPVLLAALQPVGVLGRPAVRLVNRQVVVVVAVDVNARLAAGQVILQPRLPPAPHGLVPLALDSERRLQVRLGRRHVRGEEEQLLLGPALDLAVDPLAVGLLGASVVAG